MSWWQKIRSGGGIAEDISALAAAQQRAEAEGGIEDTDEFSQGRVDYDALGMSMDPAKQTKTFGDRQDTDVINLSDNSLDGQHLHSAIFRMAGGDGTSYIPMSPLPSPKTGDVVTGEGAYAGPDQLVFGFSRLRSPA